MAEFRIEISPAGHARTLARGERLPDEVLYAIVAGTAGDLARTISRRAQVLSGSRRSERQGRPGRASVGRARLITALRGIAPDTLPGPIIPTVVRRVAERRRFTEFDRAWPVHEKSRQRTRDMLMEALVDEIGSILAAGPPYRHPILGALVADRVPAARTVSERTYELVAGILRDAEYDPPSIPRMRNIVSRRRSERRKMRSRK